MKFKTLLALVFTISLIGKVACDPDQSIAAPNNDSDGVQGDFYDDKSYDTFSEIKVGNTFSADDTLIFFATLKFTKTYIYIAKPRTYEAKDKTGMLGNTVLVTSDTHKFFIPYVFFKETMPKRGLGDENSNEKYCLFLNTDANVLSKLFPKKKAMQLKFCMLNKLEKDNIDFIAKNIDTTMKNNHLDFNALLSSLKEDYTYLFATMSYIFTKEPKLRKEKITTLANYNLAKGHVVRISMDPSVAAKFDELELSENPDSDAVDFICENLGFTDYAFLKELKVKYSKKTVTTSQ